MLNFGASKPGVKGGAQAFCPPGSASTLARATETRPLFSFLRLNN